MVFLIILLFISIILVLFVQTHRASKSARTPPGPRGLPLIGNLHQFDSSNPHYYFWKLSKQYGQLLSFRLGFVPIFVVSSAKLAKEVFKTLDTQFSGRPILLGQQTLSYNGLDLGFAPYCDAYWREKRKICVTHFFNSSRVQHFRPIREDEVSRMLEKISKSAVTSKPVNLNDIMISFTNMIICRLAFGRRYKDEGGEKCRFHALLNETQTLLAGFFFSDYFPFTSWVDNLTGKLQHLQKKFKEFDTFYQELIEEHLDPNRAKAEQEDIIDVLLNIRKDHGFKVDLSWDDIKALLMNIFVGGTNTAAAAVVWAMTYLVKNPEAMKKSQDEIRCLIGKKGFVDEDDVQRLAYLKAVVKETMRLQPPIPLNPRVATEKCILDEYEIPPRFLVFVNFWAIGRDPEAWDNPNEFYPERFIGSSIDFKGQHFELIPFGAGRRICPGMHMGIAIVELALANLLYKFDWEMPGGVTMEDIDFDVLPGITVHKKNALCLKAQDAM